MCQTGHKGKKLLGDAKLSDTSFLGFREQTEE